MVYSKVTVDFDKKIREWDGFGVNYVEVSQTRDYDKWPQEYGGISLLSDEDKKKVMEMTFGKDGIKPGVIKMFLDSHHQVRQNDDSSFMLNQENYDHKKTTRYMVNFVKEGQRILNEQGLGLTVVTALYGPPAHCTKQKVLRGRDVDPDMKLECVKYMASFAKYLKEEENIPVKYITVHNEGEDYHRWPENGIPDDENWAHGHDYNMYWPPELVAEMMPMLRKVLTENGLEEIYPTPGETTNWTRFQTWGYADAIADHEDALNAMGLITSHGFYSGKAYGRWYGDHRSAGIDILREKRPELHAWVTSTGWANMDVDFINQIHGNIYSAKVNAIIPWACIQRPNQWVGGDPNPGCAFVVSDDGELEVRQGYWFYRQVSRIGQQNTHVARAFSTATECNVIAFSGGGTNHADGFAVLNTDENEAKVDIKISGTKHKEFAVYRTSEDEYGKVLGDITVEEDVMSLILPPRSVTTFEGK